MTADKSPPPLRNDPLLAAELALGLHGRAAYDEAMRKDAALKAAIEDWENDFVGLGENLAPRPPDPRLWAKLQAQTAPQPPFLRRLFDSLILWRLLAGGAVAASIALALLPRTIAPIAPPAPQVATESSRTMLVTSLLPREGAALYLGAYNRETRQLVLVAAQTEPASGKGYHRLWLVPDDVGEPVDLGLLRRAGETVVTIDAALASSMTRGTGLVVTLEASETPPARDARGDVQAHGKFREF